METEIETRELEQIESNLAVEERAESSESETAQGLIGLFTNGFMVV